MSSKTVNISFQKSLLSDIDKVAKGEARSRSELLREAARMYIERKKQWDSIFAYGDNVASRKKLSKSDVTSEIRAYRKRKAKKR